MGLQEQQDLLARLYTDPKLFSKFEAEPESVSTQFRLTESETRDLSALAGPEVKWFADSLFWKRFRELEKLLPMSSWMIGKEFEPLFLQFSSEFNPKSVKKHLEDALGFADWLLKHNRVDTVLADVLRFESIRLRHNAEGKRFSFCRLTHDVRPVFGFGRPGSKNELMPRRSIAIWLNAGKRTRFVFL